jgi:hypothetical protein
VSGRNPDLPILDELGAEFTTLVEAAYAAERQPAGASAGAPPADRHTVRRRAPLPAAPRSRERGAQARRIGRRAAVTLVLLCLVGGVAFAALRGGGDSGGHAHTAPALLGRDPGGAWSFSAYRDGDRLCTVFVPRGGELSGSCAVAPPPGRLRAGSAIAGGHRYVFGIAGQGVARATTSITEKSLARGDWRSGAGAVRRPDDSDTASAAGFPVGDGWFVFDLGPVRAGSGSAPAVVIPLTRHGHRTGPPYVDCSLGELAPACVRRIRSDANG